MIRLLHLAARLLPCREIRDEAGSLYLARYRIVGPMNGRDSWLPFSLYLHRFHRPDDDRDLHNHPWPWAVSLILTGGYTELRNQRIVAGRRMFDAWRRRPWQLVLLRANTFHRVSALHGAETWTLFLVARKVQAWGYDVPGRGFVPWRTHSRERKAKEMINKQDTIPSPPPTEPAAHEPAPFRFPEPSPVPRIICEICDGMHGNHDPACPLHSGAVSP